ncbi:hypothetical protein CRYUN_Cryun28dG0119900 [Craigia yunnanensis]
MGTCFSSHRLNLRRPQLLKLFPSTVIFINITSQCSYLGFSRTKLLFLLLCNPLPSSFATLTACITTITFWHWIWTTSCKPIKYTSCFPFPSFSLVLQQYSLAVKASVAIQNASKNDSHRRKKARISPVLIVAQSLPVIEKDHDAPTAPGPSTKSFAKPQSQPAFSRYASIRKLLKYISRRAKLAVRFFKLRLSTIYEGSVL